VPDLFAALDRDWAEFSGSDQGSRAIRQWGRCCPELRDFADLPALVAALRCRSHPDARDRLLLVLVRLAATDRGARRAVLQVLVPGLVSVARAYGQRWGREEAESMVVAAALDRIANYPSKRTARPAANIVRDVRHSLYEARLREVALEAALGEPSALEEAQECEAMALEPSASEEVLDVVCHAVGDGTISPREGRLIVLHRVLGVRTADIASAEGRRPGTVRKHRLRAELALASAEVA
jgi:DNA-directed RNA polymerase specialized sigma24 family protein